MNEQDLNEESGKCRSQEEMEAISATVSMPMCLEAIHDRKVRKAAGDVIQREYHHRHHHHQQQQTYPRKDVTTTAIVHLQHNGKQTSQTAIE